MIHRKRGGRIVGDFTSESANTNLIVNSELDKNTLMMSARKIYVVVLALLKFGLFGLNIFPIAECMQVDHIVITQTQPKHNST